MSEGQGHLKTPAPYSDKSDIPFGLMEDVMPTAIAMTPTGLRAIPSPGKMTGEFERVYQDNIRSINLFDDDNYTERVIVHNNMIKEFFTAHNADIAAKDKENETALANERARIMRGDFNNICAYCGWEADDEHRIWEALQHHVLNCEEHPLFKANKRIAELSKAVADWQEVHAKCLDIINYLEDQLMGDGAAHDGLIKMYDDAHKRIKELEEQVSVACKALEELSKLGNGHIRGNSIGNCIAIEALEKLNCEGI
jgi:uncharacterized coiled-coil protein SlyX